MKVESLERDTTLVATLTLPNSVLRQFGICSVNFRSSSADGFQVTDFGSTGNAFAFACLEAVRAAVETAGVLERISVMKVLGFDFLKFTAGMQEPHPGFACQERQILHYAA